MIVSLLADGFGISDLSFAKTVAPRVRRLPGQLGVLRMAVAAENSIGVHASLLFFGRQLNAGICVEPNAARD